MSIKNQGEAARAAKEAIVIYDNQIKEFQNEIDETFRAIVKITESKEAVINNLIAITFLSIDNLKDVADIFKAPHLITSYSKIKNECKAAEQKLFEFEKEPRNKNISALIDPQIGTITLRLLEAEDLQNNYLKERNKYQNNRLFMRYNRNRKEHGKITFWDTILFRADDIRTNNQQIFDLFDLKILDECYERFDFVSKMYDEINVEVKMLRKEKLDLDKKWEMYKELKNIVENTEVYILTNLKEKLKIHLNNVDFDFFMKNSKNELQIYFTQCHVFQKKLNYLEDIKKYLQKEILNRRLNREKMLKVANSWSKNPLVTMSDKTKWLVEQPRIKQSSTRNGVNNIRSSRQVVDDFDDYDYYQNAYNRAYDNNTPFLAFDLFAFYSDKSPAYDGFNKTVFGEVKEFRQENGLEKVDYSFYKSFDKAYEMSKNEGDANVYIHENDIVESSENEAIEALIEASDSTEFSDIS